MLSLLVLTAGLVQAEPTDIRMRTSGTGDWQVTCTFQTTGGERVETARRRGRGEFVSLNAQDATGARCTYAVSEGGLLTVRIYEADGFACPFDEAADMDDCIRRFSGPAEGAFDLVPQT